MDPIKEQLMTNIMTNYTANPQKYSSYISRTKPLTQHELKTLLDRFFATNIEIRRQQRKAADMNQWWSTPDMGGSNIIQQFISRNMFKFIKYSMLATQTTADVEQLLDGIKQKTQAIIKLPLYVIVDECMVKARIHHLVS